MVAMNTIFLICCTEMKVRYIPRTVNPCLSSGTDESKADTLIGRKQGLQIRDREMVQEYQRNTLSMISSES